MIMRRLAIIFALFYFAYGLAYSTHYPLRVKDSRGKTITITREPKRIVSLAPNNTEILFALGIGNRVVGVTKYCNYPPAARKKPKVGDRITSVEKVIALKPDLVLAHGFLNDEAIRSIERHNIKVFALDPKTIGEVVRDIRLVGIITNREREAEKVINKISSAKRLVARQTANIKSKPRVLVAVQADPLWVAGPKTFVDEMIAIAGGVNIAHDAKPGFNQFSIEVAVSRDPEIIIGTTKGDKEIFSRGVWKTTSAVRKQRVHEIDPDLLFRPGPRLAQGILAIAKIIHAKTNR